MNEKILAIGILLSKSRKEAVLSTRNGTVIIASGDGTIALRYRDESAPPEIDFYVGDYPDESPSRITYDSDHVYFTVMKGTTEKVIRVKRPESVFSLNDLFDQMKGLELYAIPDVRALNDDLSYTEITIENGKVRFTQRDIFRGWLINIKDTAGSLMDFWNQKSTGNEKIETATMTANLKLLSALQNPKIGVRDGMIYVIGKVDNTTVEVLMSAAKYEKEVVE